MKANITIEKAIALLKIGVEAAMQVPAIKAALEPRKTLEELRIDREYHEFASHRALLERYGEERREGFHAHHLVPQHPANLEKFGVVQPDGRLVAPRLHNTSNVVWISEFRHQQITDWYNEIAPGSNRRRWEVYSDLSFEEQYTTGLYALWKFGVLR